MSSDRNCYKRNDRRYFPTCLRSPLIRNTPFAIHLVPDSVVVVVAPAAAIVVPVVALGGDAAGAVVVAAPDIFLVAHRVADDSRGGADTTPPDDFPAGECCGSGVGVEGPWSCRWDAAPGGVHRADAHANERAHGGVDGCVDAVVRVGGAAAGRSAGNTGGAAVGAVPVLVGVAVVLAGGGGCNARAPPLGRNRRAGTRTIRCRGGG